MPRGSALFTILLLGLLAACSTVEGVGRDLNDSSRWVRRQM